LSVEGIAVPIATLPSRFDTRVRCRVVSAEMAAAIRQNDSSTLFMALPLQNQGT
jgi:hypothetical protein